MNNTSCATCFWHAEIAPWCAAKDHSGDTSTGCRCLGGYWTKDANRPLWKLLEALEPIRQRIVLT